MQSIQEQSNELTNEPKASKKWWAMAAIGISGFVCTVDINIVNLALPTLIESLHTSFANIQWVSLSYLLVFVAFSLIAARLGDMWNKKWLFLAGLILFTISSLFCGFAPNVGFLIGFRALQGVGAVLISALGSAIITEVFPKEERGRALGIINAIILIGAASGPTIGGLLISLVGWRLIFLVNVPISIIASLIVALAVPDSPSGEVKKDFDVAGALLVTVTLACFAFSMTTVQKEGFGSPIALIMLAIAAIGLGCFLVVEARSNSPMLDLKIFHSLELSLGLSMRSMVSAIMVGVIFILPFFLELVKHYSAQQAGLLLAIAPIFTALMAPISGTLSDRFGSRIISLIGLVLMEVGCLAISTFDTQLTVLGYIVRLAPLALGIGMFTSPNNSAILGSVPPDQVGLASGLLTLSNTLGQTMGLALIGTLFSLLTTISANLPPNIDVTEAPIEALVEGVHMSFLLIAPILMVTIILAAFLLWLEQRKDQIQTESKVDLS
ncbi:MFS transporter [Microcoleus sp. C2C3]|uniref:MFS transporter n=1 Tax=unclassified Microcoleus TaxID=2642155 RepID=UPI002FD2CE0E